jgi:hypothetical protein
MIGDLGVHASLQGFRITKYLKYAMANNILEYKGGQIEFCPTPTPRALERVFNNLIDPPGAFYFVYFSDDSCVSIRTSSGVKRFNVDISSCDASHTTALFNAMLLLVPDVAIGDMKALINQCRTPITIRNLEGPGKVTLKPTGPRLYSGSTLTTAINNLANILIGISIAESDCQCAADITRAASKAGYIVTCDDCSDFHKLQFLKHSPVIDTMGNLRALLNIGVLLRLTGTCKGDLPGSKNTPLRTRALAFQSALLQGAYPRTSFTLIDRMKKSAGTTNAKCVRMVNTMLEHKIATTDEDESFSVSSEEVYSRYDLTALEICELDDEFGQCTYTHHYTSTGTAKILSMDYGLSGKEL